MTPVPRHIVVDLLPLYLAGELSPETHRVVEEYLRTDEPLAAQARAAASEIISLEGDRSTPLPDLELRSVRRTRALLASQRWLFGLALAFSAVGLSVSATVTNGRVRHFHLMVQDYPVAFGACLLAGFGCWIGYHRLRRQLNG